MMSVVLLDLQLEFISGLPLVLKFLKFMKKF